MHYIAQAQYPWYGITVTIYQPTRINNGKSIFNILIIFFNNLGIIDTLHLNKHSLQDAWLYTPTRISNG